MNNQLILPKNKELAQQIITSTSMLDQQKIDQGFLGKFWGNSTSIPNNIAALTIIVLIFTGIVYTIICVNIKPENISLSIKEFWSIITPLITLTIGYLFGGNTKKIIN